MEDSPGKRERRKGACYAVLARAPPDLPHPPPSPFSQRFCVCVFGVLLCLRASAVQHTARKQAPYAVGETNDYSRPNDPVMSAEAYKALALANFSASKDKYLELKNQARKASSAGVGPPMEVRRLLARTSRHHSNLRPLS